MAETFQTKFVHEWAPTGESVKFRVTLENFDMDYANSVEMQELAHNLGSQMMAWAKAKANTETKPVTKASAETTPV